MTTSSEENLKAADCMGDTGAMDIVSSVDKQTQMASPKLLALSVDNGTHINGRLIPSSSAISLLSLGNVALNGSNERPSSVDSSASITSNNYIHHHLSKAAEDYQDTSSYNTGYSGTLNTSEPTESVKGKSQISTTAIRNQSSINQQRHKYYRPLSTSGSSTSNTNISRLSAQLKTSFITQPSGSASVLGPNSPIAHSQIQKFRTSPRIADKPSVVSFGEITEGRVLGDNTPDSPNLEPTSFTNSPTKFWLAARHNDHDLPKNISHLSLSSMNISDRPSSPSVQLSKKRSNNRMDIVNSSNYNYNATSSCGVPHPSARPKNINVNSTFRDINASPVLRPVQTPGSEVCMTPLTLSYKGTEPFSVDNNQSFFVQLPNTTNQGVVSSVVSDDDYN